MNAVLPTEYQQFIHTSRYARWQEEENRRENWPETVNRYFDFFVTHLTENHDLDLKHYAPLIDELRLSMELVDTLPSMRCLMTAGPALSRDHVAGYNCAYVPIDHVRAFDEMLFILMCGAGVGFSVERQYISKLPEVADHFEKSNTTIIVRDSKRGWAEATREVIAMLYAGRVPQWDTSRVREKGAKLKTMGGRASGPGPLIELFEFLVHTFQNAQGRKLTSIECHDIACKVGDCVVMGGVRRSAMLSLSNLSDQRMRDAKTGQWWETSRWREMANNSVAYTERPEVGQFMHEWMSLYESKSGERGFFNREAVSIQAAASGRRRVYSDDAEQHPIEFGTNPCSEIILRPKQFCNLSEVVIRPEDDFKTLLRKVKFAAILGTWQSTLTDFRYLRKAWSDNCKEERLLGVSMTGMMDNNITNGKGNPERTAEQLQMLKQMVIETNKEWADILGISPATAATCVKPSGTASQLALCGSGLHSWHDRHYIRRVRQDIKDPLTQFMIEAGFPWEPDATKPEHTAVFSFPIKAPAGAVTRDDRTALEELKHWKLIQDNWCEHKPSVTITVREHEWPEVGAWVWNNFDSMSGVSFLPHSDHSYRQAPYESIDEEAYNDLVSGMPADTDWTKLSEYEMDDEHVTASREFACVGNSCEVL